MAIAAWDNLDKQHQLILAAVLGLALAAAAFLQLQPSQSLSRLCFYAELHPQCRLTTSTTTPENKPALDPKQWQRFKLIDKIVLSPNTAMSVLPFVPLPPQRAARSSRHTY